MKRSTTQEDERHASATRNYEAHRRNTSISEDDEVAESTANEWTPLLPTDVTADVLSTTATKYRVILMCAVFLFIIDVGAFIMDPPTQQLMEDIICRDRFPDHPIGKDGVGDGRCKMPEIQMSLAAIKSMNMFAQMLCPLLVQVPFGLVADKYGRRPVLFLAILGTTLNTTWSLLVIVFSDILPLWSMVPGAMFLFIGGGGTMAGAMIYTLICDVTPIAERAPVFYQMTALMLILSAVSSPLSAWLMSIDPWLPAWLGEIIMILGVFSALFVPETKTFLAEERETPSPPDHSFAVEAWKTMQANTTQIRRFILSSPRIMLLIVCESLAMPIGLALLMYALQYVSARFDMDWSKATYVISVSRITSCIMLLVVLPLFSRVLTKNFGVNPLKRDLGLARASSVSIMFGCLLLGTAGVPWMMMLALAMFGLSAGYGAQCRALITAMVEPHMMATVNTTLSMTETVFTLLGAPLIGWLLGQGLEMGGTWQGLPYLVLTLIALFMVTALCFFRIPADLLRVEEDAR